MSEAPTQCDFAYEQWKTYRFFCQLWSLLIYAFAALLVLLVGGFAAFAESHEPVGAVLTGLGALTALVVVLFAIARRDEAAKEERRACDVITAECPTLALTVRAARETRRLFSPLRLL